ncbi:MAG: glutamine synthetase [Pseudomonadota bacterium]
MSDFSERLTQEATTAQARLGELRDAGVEHLILGYPDLQGNLRTKIGPVKWSGSGDSFNGIFYCMGHGDGLPSTEPCFEAPVCSEDEGYPNILGVTDLSTAYAHPWHPGYGSALQDSYLADGRRCPIDPRGMVARLDAEAREIGVDARFALEVECGIFEADSAAIQAGAFSSLSLWGQSVGGYNGLRDGGFHEFVAEFTRRCAALDVEVTAFSTEHGFGMYEFGLAPRTALRACDDAVRARHLLRELCLERGLVATFMARFRPPQQESACGAHTHVSLWRDGQPVTLGDDGSFSAQARQFLAGMLEHLPATHLMFRPTINAYRRYSRAAWSPVDVSWGLENRAAAIRAITAPNAAAARFEHRVSGADINPYHTVAAMLAAGCDGVRRQLEPPAPLEAPPAQDRLALPATLEASLETFEASGFCQKAFGEQAHAHLVAAARFELQAFQEWLDSHITEFEWQRYFLTA